MYEQISLLVILALSAAGSSVEIGFDELPSNDPFSASCAASMRYQTLYLEDEIGTAMEIQSISLMRTMAGGSSVTLDTLAIYMGYSWDDELGTNFDVNYMSGTRQLVFWEENCTVNAPEPFQWFQIDLETPFFYNCTGNLIIEYAWPDGYDDVSNWNWTDTVERSLTSGWEAETGFTTQDCPHILLSGNLSLQNATFGFIKAV